MSDTTQQGFSDGDVLDFLNQRTTGGVAVAPEPRFGSGSDGVETENTAAEDNGESDDDMGLNVSWASEGDTVLLAVGGYFEAEVRAVERGDKTVYVSTHFGGEHTSLKKALDAVARNTASRAVAAEWERQNPKTQKAQRQRSSSTAKVDQLADQLSQMQSMMSQLLQSQGVQTPAANPARIARG